MITIELSIQITRRKFVHVARDDDGPPLYITRSISELMQWLYDTDTYEAEIIAGETRWRIELSPLPK